jgi:predicted kinase
MHLILIRGIPGSGKTFLARKILARSNCKHLEVNMYLERDGEWKYDKQSLKEGHIWCSEQAAEYLDTGHNVIVSNCFISEYSMSIYAQIAAMRGAQLTILDAPRAWDVDYAEKHNIRNLGRDKLEEMAESAVSTEEMKENLASLNLS